MEIENIKNRLKGYIDPIKDGYDEKEGEPYSYFFKEIVQKNISRKEYFDIIQELMKYYDEIGGYNEVDELYEIETAIIGDCSETMIPRFMNEPLDHNEYVSFVRGRKWMNEEFVQENVSYSVDYIKEVLKKILLIEDVEIFKNRYNVFFKDIVQESLSRKEYYDVLLNIEEFFCLKKDLKVVSLIHELQYIIRGFDNEPYTANFIPRFKNEPLDKDEFIEYVRNGEWKNS